MLTTTQFAELASEIHQQNVLAGWWNNERSKAMFFELFHSELSEAMEGIRKNLNDDKLPHYPMYKVEIADYVIRLLDYIGVGEVYESESKFNVWSDLNINDMEMSQFPSLVEGQMHFLATQRVALSNAYVSENTTRLLLCRSVVECFLFAGYEGWDIMQIINEKRDFNRHRADHKLENRAKDGGKKF